VTTKLRRRRENYHFGPIPSGYSTGDIKSDDGFDLTLGVL